MYFEAVAHRSAVRWSAGHGAFVCQYVLTNVLSCGDFMNVVVLRGRKVRNSLALAIKENNIFLCYLRCNDFEYAIFLSATLKK